MVSPTALDWFEVISWPYSNTALIYTKKQGCTPRPALPRPWPRKFSRMPRPTPKMPRGLTVPPPRPEHFLPAPPRKYILCPAPPRPDAKKGCPCIPVVRVIHILLCFIFFLQIFFFFAILKNSKNKNSAEQKDYSVGDPYFMGWESRWSRVATFMSSVASCVVSHLINLLYICFFCFNFDFFLFSIFLFSCHIHEQCGQLCGVTPH